MLKAIGIVPNIADLEGVKMYEPLPLLPFFMLPMPDSKFHSTSVVKEFPPTSLATTNKSIAFPEATLIVETKLGLTCHETAGPGSTSTVYLDGTPPSGEMVKSQIPVLFCKKI